MGRRCVQTVSCRARGPDAVDVLGPWPVTDLRVRGRLRTPAVLATLAVLLVVVTILSTRGRRRGAPARRRARRPPRADDRPRARRPRLRHHRLEPAPAALAAGDRRRRGPRGRGSGHPDTGPQPPRRPVPARGVLGGCGRSHGGDHVRPPRRGRDLGPLGRRTVRSAGRSAAGLRDRRGTGRTDAAAARAHRHGARVGVLGGGQRPASSATPTRCAATTVPPSTRSGTSRRSTRAGRQCSPSDRT